MESMTASTSFQHRVSAASVMWSCTSLLPCSVGATAQNASAVVVVDHLHGPLLSVAVNGMGAWHRLRRYGTAMRSQLLSWKDLETQPLASIEAKQLERLRYILQVASSTPFYKRVFAAARFDPERVDSVSDLERLPVLERRDLINHFDELIVPAHRRGWVERKSSGTTGQPVRYRQPARMAYAQAFAMLYGFYSWHGIRPLDRRATLAGRYLGRRASGIAIRNWFENQLLLGAHALTQSNAATYVRALNRFRPTFVQGHPSALSLLANAALDAGIEIAPIPHIVVTGESLLEKDRLGISNAYGAHVFGTYGMGENCVAAGECPQLNGYHINPAIGITELVDLGGPAPEIIATSLLNDVMPLIRYRTGDLATAIESSPCPCGRSWPRIHGLLGRSDDSIATTGGETVIAVTLRTDIGSRFRAMPPYSIVQHRVTGRYSLRLYMPPGARVDTRHEDVRQYLEAQLGPGARVELDIRSHAELLMSRSKHKLVIKE